MDAAQEWVNRVILSSHLRLMSFQHLFSLHSVLPRFRLRFAKSKRAFATKIAIHTRTWTGGRASEPVSHSLHSSVRFCARNALPHHARGTIEQGRTGGDAGRAEPLCKNRTRIQRMAREEGRRRGGVLSAGRRFANGRPLAEEGRKEHGGRGAAVAQKELHRGRGGAGGRRADRD